MTQERLANENIPGALKTTQDKSAR